MNAELDLLERNVVQARARVKDDLANLRMPVVANLKRDLVASTDDVFTNIKDRLSANPVATLAIGAGIAWRFVHRPPVASLLVGYGLLSLMRTDPRRPTAAAAYAAQAVEAGTAIAGRVTRVASDAQAAAAETLGAVQDAAAQTTETLQSNASEWADRATRTAHDASDAVARGAAAARESLPDAAQVAETMRREKDTYLLGFAAAAVVAAIGISAQRRAREG